MRHTFSKRLRVAVLGASGETGRHVTATALAHGHKVTTLVRKPVSTTPTREIREVVWADINDSSALVEAFRGADVVVSALGGAPKGPTTVCTDGISSAIGAMKQTSVTRLIAVSAHGVAETHDRSLYALAVWAGVGNKMRDKETMESLIKQSGLDWTLVRPPKLNNHAATGSYRTGTDLPIRLWSSIGRADLAEFLIREAEEPQFVLAAPRISQ